MPLEAVVVCLDNSEFNRNGDFAPSRWESQQDAATNICDVKLNQNPENTIGVMAMAGNRVDIKLTQTNDIGVILNAVGHTEINGNANFFTAVKIAQLSLKHRMNKSQRQRIIIFVGHPIKEEEAECEDLGKRLKRNNVAIDVINFANQDNVAKLQALVNAANNSDNSHFLDVPMGVSQITDVLFTSPILHGDDVAANVEGGAGAGGNAPPVNQFEEYGGINPAMDPELAQALRISMEEERARQQATEPAEQEAKPETAEEKPAEDNKAPVEEAAAEEEEYDEEYYLNEAIKLSMAEGADKDAEKEEAKPDEQVGETDLKEVVTTDFMKGLISEMGLDIDQDQMGQILDAVGGKEEKKDEEDENSDKKADEKKEDDSKKE